MTALQFLLPWGIDDPQRPSGGNRYDARVRDGLRARGWDCGEHVVAGAWPRPEPGAVRALERALGACRDDALVLVDGVLAPGAAATLVAAARRLRVVILLHMPFGEAFPELADAERRVLDASAAVVTTSAWTRDWICRRYGLPAARIRIATPGVDAAPRAMGSAAGTRLLCVANVSLQKGHDLLIEALAGLRQLDWRCACVGALPEDRGWLEELRRGADRAGIAGRLRWTGPLAGTALAAEWAAADVLVHPSRRESWGMVVSEALAHGLPVIAARAGGVAEALGRTPDGGLPGLLVDRGSPVALAAALRSWLEDAPLRARLRAAAAQRRNQLDAWAATVAALDATLRRVVQHARDLA